APRARYEVGDLKRGSQLPSESFFFSSRRRHTRFKCDWSSDVCSSDLLLAESAAKEKTGARGLLTVFEKLFRDYKYHLAGSGLSQLRVTAELVQEPKRVLERLMAQGHDHETKALELGVLAFADRFKNEHGLEIIFDDA